MSSIRDRLVKLTLTENEDNGDYEIMLDGTPLRLVEEYSIKKSSELKNVAELSIKMLVKYP